LNRIGECLRQLQLVHHLVDIHQVVREGRFGDETFVYQLMPCLAVDVVTHVSFPDVENFG
jgi:hypothetical protein